MNGAEWLVLVHRARAKGMSVPQYVMTCCGFPARVIGPPATDEGLRHGLERRHVKVRLTDEQVADVNARGQGYSVAQRIRNLCGFQERWRSVPGTEARVEEITNGCDLIESIGLEPADYFPEEF